MKRAIKYLFFFILSSISFSISSANIDSLYNYLISTKQDSNQIYKLVELAWEARLSNPDKGLTIAQTAIDRSKKIHNHYGLCRAYNARAGIYKDISRFDESLNDYLRSLKTSERLVEQDSNKVSMDLKSGALTNIGEIYIELRDLGMAKKYLLQAKRIDSLTNNTAGLSIIFNDLGNIAYYNGEFNEALSYYKKYLSIQEQIGSIKDIIVAKNNIGFTYEYMGQFNEALLYYKQANKLSYEYGSDNYIAATLTNVGSAYGRLNYRKECIEYLEKALEIAKKMNSSSRIGDVYESYYTFYKNNGEHEKALEYHILMVAEKDKILNERRNELVAEMEAKYQAERKDYEIKMLNKEKEKDAAVALADKKRKNIIILSVTTGLLMVLVFSFFLYKRFKLTKNQKAIIDQKNKDITDSINYAKRIQTALLKDEEPVSKNLPSHFIYFQPKDIVSGDFYWTHQKQDVLYLAVADCTGHGVPGAFLTMLGTAFLNEITSHEYLLSPAQILTELRKKIISELNQTGAQGETRDGMDISLLSLNIKTLELQWSGANNPLWIITKNKKLIDEFSGTKNVSNDSKTLIVINPDKQPVAYQHKMNDFTNYNLKLSKEDILYIFSDGYADQFGGEKGKKFMYLPFKKLLLSICDLEMETQKEKLQTTFVNWKGQYDQIDDVCVLGLRL